MKCSWGGYRKTIFYLTEFLELFKMAALWSPAENEILLCSNEAELKTLLRGRSMITSIDLFWLPSSKFKSKLKFWTTTCVPVYYVRVFKWEDLQMQEVLYTTNVLKCNTKISITILAGPQHSYLSTELVQAFSGTALCSV